ncbi:TetR/AcrR family transcriptional regulator [Deinococcus sonorensis]|uniref:TetR/AcrR family transcriptional regulator n=2 Tax=Deinococcus sonorensis TaxID=309891 RepID=A0AAU7U5H8_9DEIO
MTIRAPGRPRNAAHSDRAKTAALELLAEEGYAAINMETIAQRTGIARQTLYRRWPHKRALILDAFADQADQLPDLPDTGDLETDLKTLLRATTAKFNSPCGSTNRAFVAEGLQDPAVMTDLWGRHFSKRRRQVATLLQRARARGERLALDDDTLTDLLLGPLWYRLLMQHAPLDNAFADAVAADIARRARMT